MNAIKLEIGFDFGGYTKGQKVSVACDIHGTPTLQYWRNRLKDSEIDGCVSVVKSASKKKPPTGKGESSQENDK